MLAKGALGLWELVGGKHKGEELEKVAQTNPSYLTWMWNEKKVYDFLSDDEAFALDDIMMKFGISKERKKKLNA